MPLSSPVASQDLSIRTVGGNNLTFGPVLGDANNAIDCTVTGTANFELAPNAVDNFPVGTQFILRQNSAAQITIQGGAGVTIESAGSLVQTAQQFSVVTLYQSSTDVWALMGDLV